MNFCTFVVRRRHTALQHYTQHMICWNGDHVLSWCYEYCPTVVFITMMIYTLLLLQRQMKNAHNTRATSHTIILLLFIPSVTFFKRFYHSDSAPNAMLWRWSSTKYVSCTYQKNYFKIKVAQQCAFVSSSVRSSRRMSSTNCKQFTGPFKQRQLIF